MYNNLYFNNTIEDIKILQTKLKELGFFNPVVNGKFDLATSIGVKEFQKYANIDDTGIVNNETWKLLNDYTSKAAPIINVFPTLKIGDNNSYVADLKTKLKALLYYTDNINNTFDLELENAVKRFQYNNDLTADGIVGSLTWNRLNSLYENLNECATENNVDDIFVDIYTVKSGDTLYSIAKKFNTTVDDLKILNNLTSNLLNVGMVLKIPTLNDDNYIEYTVKRGNRVFMGNK